MSLLINNRPELALPRLPSSEQLSIQEQKERLRVINLRTVFAKVVSKFLFGKS